MWKQTLLFAFVLVAGSLAACGGRTTYVSYSAPPPPRLEVYSVTPPPPPAPRVEVYSVAPGPGYVWSSGYWNWTGTSYTWIPGHWVYR